MRSLAEQPTDDSRSAPPPAPSRGARAWQAYLAVAPRVISSLALLLGVVLIVDVLLASHHQRMQELVTTVLPVPARATVEAVVVVGGWLLLRVARGLRMRKKTEWRIAVAVTAALTAADALREERRPVEAVVTGLLLVALLLARSRYTADADPRSRWFAARVVSQFVAVGVAYGLFLTYLPHHVATSVSFPARLREVVFSLVGAGGTIVLRDDHYADFFHATLLGLGLVALAGGVLLVMRPVQPQALLAEADEQQLRELLARHGDRDSLGYFALRRDKAVVWSATGKAAITYRVVSGVALASGDPIGDPEAWPGAITAFRELVERYGWTPAVLGCSELGATVYQRVYGLAAVGLGDEAVLKAADFTLEGRSMRGIRQACTRVQRAGYDSRVRRMGELEQPELDEIRRAADAWRGDAVERGYSMALSRLGDPADPDCVVVTARQDGRLRGVLHFVPWGPTGLSLDLMRRDRDSDNGLNEFMIAELMRACPAVGVDRVSLNFAVFREALYRGQRIGAGPVLRLWRRVLLLASRWWQIESLYRFNDKFAPEWLPRFLSYPRARDLPRIALAGLEAEAFIVRPRRINRLLGR